MNTAWANHTIAVDAVNNEIYGQPLVQLDHGIGRKVMPPVRTISGSNTGLNVNKHSH
jgi:hypothetical protein